MIQTGIEALRWTIEMVAQWKIWVVYGISILYILFFWENRKAKDFAKVSLIGIFFIFNPLFAGLVIKLFFSYSRYFRILWILPIYFVIAMAATEISAERGRAVLCICTCVICIAGSLMYTTDNFELPKNLYKVPQSAVDICEYFKDTEEYQSGEVKICVEPYLSAYIRQVDGNIRLEFGREIYFSNSVKSGIAYNQLYYGDERTIDVSILADALKTDHCQYFVIDEGKVNKTEMQEFGYIFTDLVGEYEIYKAL